MPLLVDTNVLVRFIDEGSDAHPECEALLRALRGRPHPLVICLQNLIEFWVVATRPVTNNGFGLAPATAASMLDDLSLLFPCLDEPQDVGDRWRRLVQYFQITGKQAHDARLVAVMQGHGITQLLTLNASDFERYRGITILTPAEVVKMLRPQDT